MFQTKILEINKQDENKEKRKGGHDLKRKPTAGVEEEDTTVISINDSFTQPITFEAVIEENYEEKTVENASCIIETSVEVHDKGECDPRGRKKERKSKDKSDKSDVGDLLERGEKVCLATSSKKKSFARPEVQLVVILLVKVTLRVYQM